MAKDRLNETGKRVAETIRNGGQPVYLNELNNSYKHLGYMGDVAVAGVGLGLSWYALKKMVERAYQKRLEKAIREQQTVEDTYKASITPVTNEYVTNPEEPYKEASLSKSATDADPITYDSINHAKLNPKSNELNLNEVGITDPNGPSSLTAATEMAKKPYVYNTLAVASLPAILALATWGANSAAKKVLENTAIPKIKPDLKPEIDKAKKKYRDAALLLKYIASGEAYKKEASTKKPESSKEMEKDGGILFPLLGGIGIGGAALYGANRLYNDWSQPDPKNVIAGVESPRATPNPVANKGINIALGLGALALMYPGYKFVQSMRKAYKDRKGQVFDATRAAKLWKPLQERRLEQFVTLQAALEKEPELLKELEARIQARQMNPVEEPTQTV